jgi:sugar lactone lactonase YvrE
MRLRNLGLLAALALTLTTSVAAAAAAFPATIPLPRGFQPEGIAIRGNTFYVGSIPTGAVYRGNVRTGQGAVLVQGATGRAATGIAIDNRNRLFVAGAGTGRAFVYNARTGALIRSYMLASAPTFINDVVVTRTAAYLTDSQKRVLYRVAIGGRGALADNAQTIPLTGDFELESGFNANGIDATPNGRWLVIVQSNTGELFRVNPSTGATTEIALGGATVPNGDGILLDGRTLYVVQNQLNQIAVIRVNAALTSGTVRTRITDSRFVVPTTIDDHGRRLYAVNARFNATTPSTTDYQVIQVRKPPGS